MTALEVTQSDTLPYRTVQHLRWWSGSLQLCLFSRLYTFISSVLQIPSLSQSASSMFLSGHLNNGLPRMKCNTQVWWVSESEIFVKTKIKSDDLFIAQSLNYVFHKTSLRWYWCFSQFLISKENSGTHGEWQGDSPKIQPAKAELVMLTHQYCCSCITAMRLHHCSHATTSELS